MKVKPWLLPMAITMTALMAIFVFCFVLFFFLEERDKKRGKGGERKGVTKND